VDIPHLTLFTVAALALPLTGAARQPAPVPHGDKQLLLDHRSAFTEYRVYQDPGIVDWPATNDEVARVRGHIGIFGGAGHAGQSAEKGSSAAQSAGEAPQRSAPDASASGHKDHR
jgi:hypothetical protein